MTRRQTKPSKARYTSAPSPSTVDSEPAPAQRLQQHYAALDYALPSEMLAQVFKEAIAQLLQQDTTDPTLGAQAVQHFLRSAALVHRSWTPIAQEMLLRNAYVTLNNYRHFLRTLGQCSSALIDGVQSIRFGGATRWATSQYERALVDTEEVELSTRMVKKVTGMLPGLKEAEFTRMALWELEWLPRGARESLLLVYRRVN